MRRNIDDLRVPRRLETLTNQAASASNWSFEENSSMFGDSDASGEIRPRFRVKQPEIEALLSLEEAMEILRIGRTLLYKLMDRGNLPWIQIGRTRQLRRADLIRFIEENRKGGGRVA